MDGGGEEGNNYRGRCLKVGAIKRRERGNRVRGRGMIRKEGDGV